MSIKINLSELNKKFAHEGELSPQDTRDLLDWAAALVDAIQGGGSK